MAWSSRRCKRKFCAKRLLLLVLGCVLVVYIISVIVRVPKSREVWQITGEHNVSDGFCGVRCQYGQVSFYIRTGYRNQEGPTICFQNTILMSKAKGNVHRGMNVVIINEQTLQVQDVRTFDTYLDDREFVKTMKLKTTVGNILLLASHDEMTVSLKEEGRRWLKVFGSEYIDDLNFRDAFFLIGQKGLRQGLAVEGVSRKSDSRFAPQIKKAGCLTLPLGPVLPIEQALPMIVNGGKVLVGDELTNCGLRERCGEGHLPVMVYTGEGSTMYPEICVNGYMIMQKDLNGAGRGINVVIIDHKTGQPKHAKQFDTYLYVVGSKVIPDPQVTRNDERRKFYNDNLEKFLAGLAEGDIIIATSFDDASRKLSYDARELLNKYGSSQIQNVKFRDVWYFIGQKGMIGFTNMEKISYSGMYAEWPKPLRDSLCVPRKLVGSKVIPDPQVTRNDERRKFCKKFDGYAEFCDPSHIDDPPVKPVLLVDDAMKTSHVYTSPIVIIPGMNHNALVRTIETTLMQPGVQLNYTIVAWDEKFPEHAELADMFGVLNLSLSSSTLYQDQMMKAIDEVAQNYPDSRYLIVLEEELILAPDFLSFLAQVAPVVDMDPTLLGVSAFNYNGFETSSGIAPLLYRVEEFPGLGFMLKMSVYKSRMKGNLKICCSSRAWDGWSLPLHNSRLGGEMVIPDVSRVYRQPYEGSRPDEEYLLSLFHIPRATNLNTGIKVYGLHHMVENAYESLITSYLIAAKLISHKELSACITSNRENGIKLPMIEGSYVVYYSQKNAGDYVLLRKLCACFGLFSLESYTPKNLHNGLLRFVSSGSEVFLVGSSTKYAAFKPKNTSYFVL